MRASASPVSIPAVAGGPPSSPAEGAPGGGVNPRAGHRAAPTPARAGAITITGLGGSGDDGINGNLNFSITSTGTGGITLNGTVGDAAGVRQSGVVLARRDRTDVSVESVTGDIVIIGSGGGTSRGVD